MTHKDSATATDGVIDWIAEVREPSVFYIQGESVRIEEIMKRALLFADLLAALKMATDALASDTDEWGSIRHKTEVAQARAAIAKAKT